MKHIIHSMDETIYNSPLLDFYFQGQRMGTLDIETTGLSPDRSRFILGGLCDFESKEFHQFFAESPKEEAEALTAYLDQLSKLDVVISYNGRHFDLPFMEARYRHCFGHDYEGRMPFHLDLYLILNGHSPIRQFLPNLRQKSVENYMGLWDKRADEINGAESVELYYQYVKDRDPQKEHLILLHNRDDVLQLARLLPVIAKCDFHKAMYRRGFPAGDQTVEKVRIHRDTLEFSGIQRNTPCEYRCWQVDEYPASAVWNMHDRSFRVTVPIIREKGVAVVDLEAAGIDESDFRGFPTCSSGFLAIESQSTPHYMEIALFVMKFMDRLVRTMGKEQ